MAGAALILAPVTNCRQGKDRERRWEKLHGLLLVCSEGQRAAPWVLPSTYQI